MVSFIVKLLAKVLIVVNLAIKRDPECPRLIGHRLMPPRREVDDGQPPMGQPDRAVDGPIDARVIGASMCHGVTHTDQFLTIVHGARGGNSDNSAHNGFGWLTETSAGDANGRLEADSDPVLSGTLPYASEHRCRA